MQTANIISTPNVQGNIGSCTTQVVTQAVSRDSFFTGTWKDIATNSCTGQTQETYYWQVTGDTWGLCWTVVGLTIACLVVLGIIKTIFD